MSPLRGVSPAVRQKRGILRRGRAGVALLCAAARTARDRRGFTLVETLVVILAGTIVTGATYSILDISLRQSSRIADRVSADQRGRLAMEKIMLELHSTCVSIAGRPIQPESTATNIKLLSRTGSEAYFTTMTKHEIFLPEKTETLKDATYQSNGGSEGKWTFPGTPTSTVTLLTGVSQSAKGITPIFEYFKYIGTTLSTTPLKTPLSEADAKATAKVTVNFTVAPESGNVSGPYGDRQIELGDSAVFRLTPSNQSGGNEPCE